MQIAGADGELRWLLVSKVPIRDRCRIVGVLGTYDNITVRKLAEEERDSLRLYLREVCIRSVSPVLHERMNIASPRLAFKNGLDAPDTT